MVDTKHTLLAEEADFGAEELFFSITDLKGNIISGNETFIRISGYSKEELLGHPHNIVRHFDMPRVIFKLFWNYIQKGKPVVAYVKNKTKEGNYYWVLAAVFPLEDHFVSIRIKPKTKYFDAIREIYLRLIMAEAKYELGECDALLDELLLSNGFESYDQFMHEALISELLERKKTLKDYENVGSKTFEETPFGQTIQEIYNTSEDMLCHYEKQFEKVESFHTIKKMFEEKSLSLNTLARDVVLLSLNASVASYKLEENGETFAVLASDIRTNAKQNDSLIASIDANAQILSAKLNEIIFLVSSISLQIEMVHYFIKELIINKTTICDKELQGNLDTLFELLSSYNTQLNTLPHEVRHLLEKTDLLLEDLEQQIMYLGYVQVYGIIESSRSGDDALGFHTIFSQLKSLIEKIEQEIAQMVRVNLNFNKDTQTMIEESRVANKRMQCLDKQIIKLEQMECSQ